MFVRIAAGIVFAALLGAAVSSPGPRAEETEPAPEPNPMVLVKTNLGDFTIELYPDKAPITVENFLNYVEKKFYDGTIFHRVMPGFMIQGGGFLPDMVQKEPGAPIKNEADNGLKNEKYTISMARTNVIDSATSQFFINVVDNDRLDHKSKTPAGYGYAVFGKVVEGTAIVEAIKDVKTTKKGHHENVPIKPVIISRIRVIEPEEE